MSRILVLNPFGATESFGQENLERVARPDTDFDVVDIREQYPLRNNQWLYFRHECVNFTIERVLAAQAEGYDAVFLSCMLDVGLYECRHLVDIPITAPLESAALLAHQMGRGFSILSVDRQNGEIQRMLLEMYGLAGRLTSIRHFDIDANDLYPERTPASEVVRRVLHVASECVSQDGAEVLVPGCTLAGSVLTHAAASAEQDRRTPILDGMIAGFKFAEMWADLAKAGIPPTSQYGFFQHPPADELSRLRDAIGKPRVLAQPSSPALH
jgi:Asp/Glu/hydantoin racemase